MVSINEFRCHSCGKKLSKSEMHLIITIANDVYRKYSRIYVCEECLKKDVLPLKFGEEFYEKSPETVKLFWDFVRACFRFKEFARMEE